MNMPLVSIVIPIYKVEKYIERCINSILKQTYTKIEVILIDDGSPDNCPQICEEYALRDERIKVFHTVNKGVSAARNLGINMSTGEYIMFCDGDDFVKPDWCEVLLNIIYSNPDSLVICNFDTCDDLEIINDTELCVDYEVRPITYFELYKSGCFSFVWNKIFSLSIIKENGLLFDENCGYSEDTYFVIDYCNYCKNRIIVTSHLYYYVQRDGSIIHTYYPNLLEMHLPIFWRRLPLMTDDEKVDYCDNWLYRFMDMFNNVFDIQNNMNYLKKLKMNQKAVCTEEFQYCVHKASGKNENPIMLNFLRKKNYYAYWIMEKLGKIKSKIKNR